MGRGILAGLVWGSILSVMLVWMASQMSGMVEVLKAPEQVAVTAPAAVSAVPAQDTATPVPAENTAPVVVAEPQSTEPEESVIDAIPQAETAPAVVPETSEAAVAPLEPSGGDAPSVPAASEAPAPVTTTTQAPATAEVDAAPQVAAAAPVPQFGQPIIVEPEVFSAQTLPSEPLPKTDTAPATANVVVAAPAIPEADLPPASEQAPQSMPTAEPEVAPAPEVIAEFASPVEIETAPEQPVEPEVAPTPEIIAELEPPAAIEAAPEQPAEPEVAPAPEIIAEIEPHAKIEPTPEQPAEPSVVPEPEDSAADTETVGTLGADGGLANLAPEVKVNRLPTIGGQTEEATPEVEAVPDAALAGPAITRFAAPFDNSDNRPIMAILLIDEGGARQSIEEMAAFPFPVSYVIDASRPDAAEAMADYRAAGREVVAMMPLPEGAAPQDVEVSFEIYLARMPEVVAAMDTKAAAFQSGRKVASQVAEILADHGMGMITYSKGLNAATQLASREGVPAKLVFREFDNAGQNGAAIQRFLDQAAFRAGQQSGVILVGHNRPDTVTAVLEWGLGNRAATLALAPISAALLAQ